MGMQTLPKKKILILYASAGEGHKKAAIAIASSFEKDSAIVEISLKDGLSFSSKLFEQMYAGGYLFLVKHCMQLWGFFYYLLDNPVIYKLFSPLRHLINKIAFRKLLRYIETYNPDCIISTHFMPNELISNLKKHIFTVSCVTDYKVHWFWVSSLVDHYFVATEATKEDLIKKGIVADKIQVTGIPINTQFYDRLQKQTAQHQMGMPKDMFTLLIIGGGYGVGPLENLVKTITSQVTMAMQLIVVCGKNAPLYNTLSTYPYPSHIIPHIYGFTDQIPALMAASDLMISKAGGLILTEALAQQLPCIMISPILGQETNNAEIFVELGFAKKADTIEDALRLLQRYGTHPEELEQMRICMKNNESYQGTKRIYEYISTR